jgi:hypothetical protein
LSSKICDISNDDDDNDDDDDDNDDDEDEGHVDDFAIQHGIENRANGPKDPR